MSKRVKEKDPDYNPFSDTESSEDDMSQGQPEGGAAAAAVAAVEERTIDLTNADTNMDAYLHAAQNDHTRRSQESTVKQFNDVMKALRTQTGGNQYKSLMETDIEHLPANLCRYLAVLVNKDGTNYNSSSLKQYYNRIAKWILKNRNVNIKEDPRFSDVTDVLKKRCSDSIKAGKRPGICAATAVPDHLTQEAVKQGKFSRDSPRTLLRAVVYHLMTSCGLRAVQVKHYFKKNKSLLA